jgi:hypothetical protein
METGSRGAYFWLTTSEHDLYSLLESCPPIVLDKYIAITSFDSGPLSLNPSELEDGWESRAEIAYSPRITSIEKLPHDVYDEWYVFRAQTDVGKLFRGNVFETWMRVGQVAAFVNFGGFSLHHANMQTLADLFWEQLELIQPESFIADGDLLNFVTRDRDLFTTVYAAFRET